MFAGITIQNDIDINIGKDIDELIEELKANNIDVYIPLDRKDKHGVYETIMNIRKLDIEVTATDRHINYIRSGDNEYSHLIKLDYLTEGKKVEIDDIRNIKDTVSSKYTDCKIIIEQIDTDKTILRFVITDDINRIRISVNRDKHGNIYFNTFNLIG